MRPRAAASFRLERPSSRSAPMTRRVFERRADRLDSTAAGASPGQRASSSSSRVTNRPRLTARWTNRSRPRRPGRSPSTRLPSSLTTTFPHSCRRVSKMVPRLRQRFGGTLFAGANSRRGARDGQGHQLRVRRRRPGGERRRARRQGRVARRDRSSRTSSASSAATTSSGWRRRSRGRRRLSRRRH